MNFKPFEELSSLLNINNNNNEQRNDLSVPKELLEFFFKRCEILEIDRNNFNRKNRGNKINNLQILNRKSGNQNCYFILDGKVETRVGKE